MSLGGLCDYELNEENCLFCFFTTADQMNLAARVFDVGFDGTYKSDIENFYLHQGVALDMNFLTITVCIAFISRETSTLLSQFMSFFGRSTNNREVVCIVTDDSPGIAGAITQAYPNSNHILCFVHLIRNVIKRFSPLSVVNRNIRRNVLPICERSRAAKKQKWSDAFRPSATLPQQNNTNFVETTHRILKMHQVNRKTPVLKSIFSVLLRTGYWMEARFQKYTSDCRNKANIGREPQIRRLQERLTPASCQLLKLHLCTPVIEIGFPTLLDGLSVSINPIESSDIRFSFSPFRKQHPRPREASELDLRGSGCMHVAM
ncbi:unnamed protein product [Schistosoma margrebowiei]|uniref:Uncharacterized protein n=1 Tax=Schistosoma margrebowiei TaxID=48269 RepID=A0A183MLE4_9TREM|nr:unnamed protein product [Schistosoma margrebowiei]